MSIFYPFTHFYLTAMASKNAYVEERISDAFKALDLNPRLTIAAAVRELA